jgi:hypothetical protein
LFQASGDLAQQLVAGRMPQRIVDILEVVQVQEDHAKVPAAAQAVFTSLRDAILQQDPIGQIGQGIVVGQVGHALGHGASLSHVLEHHHRPHQLALPAEDGRH